MPPHLPTFELPSLSFGWLLIASLAWTVIRPRSGLAVHWGMLIVAAVFDQFRLQPQFFSIALLMAACVLDAGHRIARWSLVSTWVWAGLHKLLSPDWFGYASHWLVARSGLDADSTYLWFAGAVAAVELAVGVLAIFRPRWAAPACLAMHLGIALTISPLIVNWNESVLPWNLSVAVIGSWVMLTTKSWRPAAAWEKAVCAVSLLGPIGFYGGYVDHGFSGVLYSGSIPQGLITSRTGTHPIEGWGDLHVPFPKERRTIRIYFEQVAMPGDKLHLADPRPWLDDAFYALDSQGNAQAIDRDEFLAGIPVDSLERLKTDEGVALAGSPNLATIEFSGVGIDSRRSLFELQKAGVRMVRRAEDQPIFAIEFTAENFDPSLLEHVAHLPNLMQIQLAGTSVQDEDLSKLVDLRLLTGIGLNQTSITDRGISHLSDLPFLQHIECEGTSITAEGLDAVVKTPF
ncbi:putative transmembrane protein [Rhodopirellula islandica]|uniref:Transmembrane protein n=2 Tax=Rhodopirellula islandica TaxID=595434 RepID=A0A0J1BFX1_RHOIS|nr:putative transmembrane protein [Rhodopirellula islandica]